MEPLFFIFNYSCVCPILVSTCTSSTRTYQLGTSHSHVMKCSVLGGSGGSSIVICKASQSEELLCFRKLILQLIRITEPLLNILCAFFYTDFLSEILYLACENVRKFVSFYWVSYRYSKDTCIDFDVQIIILGHGAFLLYYHI